MGIAALMIHFIYHFVYDFCTSYVYITLYDIYNSIYMSFDTSIPCSLKFQWIPSWKHNDFTFYVISYVEMEALLLLSKRPMTASHAWLGQSPGEQPTLPAWGGFTVRRLTSQEREINISICRNYGHQCVCLKPSTIRCSGPVYKTKT